MFTVAASVLNAQIGSSVTWICVSEWISNSCQHFFFFLKKNRLSGCKQLFFSFTKKALWHCLPANQLFDPGRSSVHVTATSRNNGSPYASTYFQVCLRWNDAWYKNVFKTKKIDQSDCLSWIWFNSPDFIPSCHRARYEGEGGGGSGFISGVSDGSHYHQGKLAALSLQSWPRSLCCCKHRSLKLRFRSFGVFGVSYWPDSATLLLWHTQIYMKNSSIRLKYVLLYCCWWLILLCREVLGEPVIQLCIHSRNLDHSLAVCFLMLLWSFFFFQTITFCKKMSGNVVPLSINTFQMWHFISLA